MDIFLYFFFRVAQLPGGFFGTPLDSRGRLMPTNMQCIYYELRLRGICILCYIRQRANVIVASIFIENIRLQFQDSFAVENQNVL